MWSRTDGSRCRESGRLCRPRATQGLRNGPGAHGVFPAYVGQLILVHPPDAKDVLGIRAWHVPGKAPACGMPRKRITFVAAADAHTVVDWLAVE